MGVVADAVLSKEGHVTGIITKQLDDIEVGHKDLTVLEVVDTMHERKARMAELSGSVISLPGGVGTWEEFYEALAWNQLGFYSKPIILLNIDNYYDDLFNFTTKSVKEGFLPQKTYEDLFLVDNIDEAIDINIKGTLRMLDLAKKSLAKHFYFSDTSAEYDSFIEQDYFPTTEWMAPNTITPMGYYAITKMAAAQFVRSFGKSNNIGTTLFRYTNIYGPSMNLERDIPPVVGSFASRLLKGKDCIIYGDGSKRRDFLYIDDLSDLHLAALKNRQNKKDSHTFNGGSGENFSISQVWETVYESCQKYYPNASGKIAFANDQPNEARQTLVNIDKTKELLGWEPKISFDDGVERTVKGLWEMGNGD